MKLLKKILLPCLIFALALSLMACKGQARSAQIQTTYLPRLDEVGTEQLLAKGESSITLNPGKENECMYKLADTRIYGPFHPDDMRPAAIQTSYDQGADVVAESYCEAFYDGNYFVLKVFKPADTLSEEEAAKPRVYQYSAEDSMKLMKDGQLDEWMANLAIRHAQEITQSFYESGEAERMPEFESFSKTSDDGTQTKYVFAGRTITGPLAFESVTIPHGFVQNEVRFDGEAAIRQVRIGYYGEGLFIYEDKFLPEGDAALDGDLSTKFVELSATDALKYVKDGFLKERGLAA